jgi:proteic killer suppression protein
VKDFSVQSNESKSQKCNRTSLKLDDLKAPPGNRLEALKGDYKGRHSIRINDQYRIVFKFVGSDAFDVEITDYHR